MPTFYIKQNDTSPVFEATCRDGDGNAVPITGSTVRFHMRNKRTRALKVDAAATISDGPGGVVQYQWVSGDTDTPGYYDVEVEVTFAGGAIQTFPNSGYETVQIDEELS